MDNFLINIVYEGEGTLATALQLASRSYKAIGYAIRDASPGERWDGEKYMKDPRQAHMMGWYREPKPRRLVFFWSEYEKVPDMIALPFKLDAAGMADFATRWLAEQDFGKQPDHDGDNGRGWRVYCEGWGHVDSHHSAFVAVAPSWAMYGK